MKYLANKRLIGSAASLAAAYAFVLHVVLSSLIASAMSPAAYAAGMQICANNPDVAAAHDDAGKAGSKTTVHHQACVCHHAAGTPPPSGSYFAVRVAIASTPVFAPTVDIVAPVAISSHSARGPPHLS